MALVLAWSIARLVMDAPVRSPTAPSRRGSHGSDGPIAAGLPAAPGPVHAEQPPRLSRPRSVRLTDGAGEDSRVDVVTAARPVVLRSASAAGRRTAARRARVTVT